jgi:hypothetical protein
MRVLARLTDGFVGDFGAFVISSYYLVGGWGYL